MEKSKSGLRLLVELPLTGEIKLGEAGALATLKSAVMVAPLFEILVTPTYVVAKA